MPGDCSIFPSKCSVAICKHKNDRNNNYGENLNITMEKDTTERGGKKASVHVSHETAT